ncbi:MAG: DUF4404 family protein [Halieaceae bacterium]|jgi:hypothetical protein|nr:DUF4404 family protein [Halieaceae bacterium]
MSKDEILKDLSSLLDEVDRLPLEAQERERLHGLISDVEQHLDDDIETPDELDIVDTVEELATRLEADHPRLVGVLRRVMNTLASMGV